MSPHTLDLSRLDFDSVPGSAITVNGVEYLVGDYVGMGGFKVVYELINARSKLCHHVIKIYRDPSAWEFHRDVIDKLGYAKSRGSPFPHAFHMAAYGGSFHIEEFLGPPAREGSPMHAVGEEVVKLQGKPSADVLPRLEALVRSHPTHTFALHVLATAYAINKQLAKAIEYQARAVEIEPHHCPYSYQLISFRVAHGALHAAIGEYNRLCEVYPYSHDIDTVVAEALLASGEPAAAAKIVEVAFFNSKAKKRALLKQVQDNVVARRRALEMSSPVLDFIKNFKYDTALHVLEEAWRVYAFDCVLNLNYALALGRSGEYETARRLFAFVLNAASDSNLHLVALANYAFTELAAQAYEKALGLLQMLQDTLIERNGGHSDVSPWDVPGMAVFWSEESGVLEELPETPLRLLEAAIPHADVNGQATLAFFVDRFRLTNEAMR